MTMAQRQDDAPSELGPPNDLDLGRIARQWLRAQELVAQHLPGEVLDQSLDDLGILQRLLDGRFLHPERTWDLQCLGIAFGRVLAKNVEGFDWAVYALEESRDPTLRYQQTSLRLNVLTMISKRVERGETPDVVVIYQDLLQHVDEHIRRGLA